MRTADGWRLARARGRWEHLRGLFVGHGERDVLRRCPEVLDWAREQWPHALAELSTAARPLSALWLDKQPDANWRVPWHQDLHVPLAPFSADGWGPWTAKAGLPHVRPPEPWRSRRITMRLHLDPCGADDGPLEVIPGSHRAGMLSPQDVDAWVARGPLIPIHAEPGDLLLMHPLLLHRSAPASAPSHRRVLQVEWCDAPLPPGAAWLDAAP